MIGVIEIPALDERVHAQRGGGAWRQQGQGKLQAARVGLEMRIGDDGEGEQVRGAGFARRRCLVPALVTVSVPLVRFRSSFGSGAFGG